jgi:hypothetical protein
LGQNFHELACAARTAKGRNLIRVAVHDLQRAEAQFQVVFAAVGGNRVIDLPNGFVVLQLDALSAGEAFGPELRLNDGTLLLRGTAVGEGRQGKQPNRSSKGEKCRSHDVSCMNGFRRFAVPAGCGPASASRLRMNYLAGHSRARRNARDGAIVMLCAVDGTTAVKRYKTDMLPTRRVHVAALTHPVEWVEVGTGKPPCCRYAT